LESVVDNSNKKSTLSLAVLDLTLWLNATTKRVNVRNLRDGSKDQGTHDTDNFDVGDKGHGCTVVLVSPHLDLARDVGDLGISGISDAGRRSREDGREDVGPCIIERVEEGKDRVGNERG
jgi:hypothetical protein